MASKNFFLSYARVDIQFATKLVNDLLAEGVDIWVDHLDIEKGEEWDIAIENALENAKCIVVLLSSTAVKNRNVRNEIELALLDDKELIPLLIENCKPPLSVIRKQRIDFTFDYDTALNELLDALNFPVRTTLKVAVSPFIETTSVEPEMKDQKIDSLSTDVNFKSQDELKIDVWISYSAIDDTSFNDGEIGWVTNFHRNLEKSLNLRLGYQVKLCRNPSISSSTDRLSEIEYQNKILQNTKVFVSILTPAYVNSNWCINEFETFVKESEKTGGWVIGNHSRIFPVYLAPVGLSELPDELQSLRQQLGYQFYSVDDNSLGLRKYDLNTGDEFRFAYYNILDNLVYDISEMLKKFDEK